MMVQSWAAGTWEITNHGRFINQFLPNISNSKGLTKKCVDKKYLLCLMKYIYIYIYIYIHTHAHTYRHCIYWYYYIYIYIYIYTTNSYFNDFQSISKSKSLVVILDYIYNSLVPSAKLALIPDQWQSLFYRFSKHSSSKII